MPTYCDRDDVVKAAGGEAELLPLVDLDGDGDEDDGLVDEAIGEAEAFVNGYIRVQKAVPLDPVPEVIRRLTARLAVFQLRADTPGMALTELDEQQYERDLTWLDKFARTGIPDLGVANPPPNSDKNASSTTERPCWKSVSRKKMGGFV